MILNLDNFKLKLVWSIVVYRTNCKNATQQDFVLLYRPRQAKMCLQACAKCIDSDLIPGILMSSMCIWSPLMHSIMLNDSVSGEQRP